jgi:hypothetical protein
MDCSFHYHGPVEATPDDDCVTCESFRKKKCVTHDKAFTKGCAHCESAQGAPCQAHWGLDAALSGHAKNIPADSVDEYEDAAARTLKAAKATGKPRVRADFRANLDPTTSTYEYFVSVRTH